MKKVLYVFLIVVLVSLLVSNVSENEFNQMIDNSKDPFSELYSERIFKNANFVMNSSKNYFDPVFEMNYLNLGFFSIANINYGWGGNLRIDGKVLDELVDKNFQSKYIIVYGKCFNLKKN